MCILAETSLANCVTLLALAFDREMDFVHLCVMCTCVCMCICACTQAPVEHVCSYVCVIHTLTMVRSIG